MPQAATLEYSSDPSRSKPLTRKEAKVYQSRGLIVELVDGTPLPEWLSCTRGSYSYQTVPRRQLPARQNRRVIRTARLEFEDAEFGVVQGHLLVRLSGSSIWQPTAASDRVLEVRNGDRAFLWVNAQRCCHCCENSGERLSSTHIERTPPRVVHYHRCRRCRRKWMLTVPTNSPTPRQP